MSEGAGQTRRRRWLAPEVVQTSSMDCGPAALKCLLEGFGVPISYGRLREACQTDVDGTSIDTIEAVANRLGVVAEQEMLPLDHLFLDGVDLLPALFVVRHSDGPTHFVVAWRRVGDWLQVMDPSVGRRWVRIGKFRDEIFRQETSVRAREWRAWAETDEFQTPLRARLKQLGIGAAGAGALIADAASDPIWFSFGVLDASVRLVNVIAGAGGVSRGGEATRLLTAMFDDTRRSTGDVFRFIPREYWSVSPDPTDYWTDDTAKLLLRGAVLMRVSGRAGARERARGETAPDEPPLSPELAAALAEKPLSPPRMLWGMLREDGLLAPMALAGAIVIATGAAVIEALLFRGLLDIGSMLNLPGQRLAAAFGLVAFAGLLMAIRIPVIAESMRMGRRFDAGLRMALLRKLPRLADRYFQSRPISDMADRAHGVHLARLVPGLGVHFLQTLCELFLTLAGVLLLDPASLWPALALTAFALAVPALTQPMINERDLRVRNHAGALNGFYLDTLLGLVPVRTHAAGRAVRRQHESLLVEWARSSRRLARTAIVSGAVQAVGCVGLASYLLMAHFQRGGGVTGADLLLIFWTLKLPAVGAALTGLAQQYPMQRNMLLRLLEPLSAPEALPSGDQAATPAPRAPAAGRGVAIDIADGVVLAAGREILREVNLSVAAGEQVGIVGVSGAGKSSLVGLLLGWHRLASGGLRVDGEELTAERQVALRHEIAWLDPAIHLWNRSLLENLNYASRDPDFGRTAGAIDEAGLREVLKKLPEGLQTSLGEGGALLSGGEGQRVRLGRALLQSGVRLALLDEPFRGMDRERRAEMLAGAREHWRDATLLCVTHDVGETMGFDRVLVVEAGRIVEDGPPSRLALEPTRYRQLLEAERVVRGEMWAGAHWRHVRMRDGRVVEEAS